MNIAEQVCPMAEFRGRIGPNFWGPTARTPVRADLDLLLPAMYPAKLMVVFVLLRVACSISRD
jgi:hypothetical protein